MLSLFLLLSSIPYTHSSPSSGDTHTLSRDVPKEGYYNPYDRGGSMLVRVPETEPLGQTEPLNIIISGHSDVAVLADQKKNGGLGNFFLSIGFSRECFGQHMGNHQAADLGDGDGYHNETAVMRWNYGDPQIGSCQQSIHGGNHFRYWIQDGRNGNSGAVFMAASYEMSALLEHKIVPNGYNLGRDWLVGNITGLPINLTNATTYTGTTSWANYTYQSNIRYVTGLVPNINIGINHNNLTVGAEGVNASDGFVAVIEVRITGKPTGKSSIHTCPILLLLTALVFTLLIST